MKDIIVIIILLCITLYLSYNASSMSINFTKNINKKTERSDKE